MSVGLHYEVDAYVAEGGVIHPRPHGDTWVSANTVYTKRPMFVRFAIVRKIPLRVNRDVDPNTPLYVYGAPDPEWQCWDFHDDVFMTNTARRGGGEFRAPGPKWTADNPDALVMKAVALMDHV